MPFYPVVRCCPRACVQTFGLAVLDWCARGCGFETWWSHNIWCQKCWLTCTPKHGSQGWYDIVDSMVNGVGLPDLGIGWEVTCDVMSCQWEYQALKKRGRNVVQCCPRAWVWTFGLVVECWTDVREVVGSRLGGVTTTPRKNQCNRFT